MSHDSDARLITISLKKWTLGINPAGKIREKIFHLRQCMTYFSPNVIEMELTEFS